MVAGYYERAYPCCFGPGDSFLRLRARRIDHANQSSKHEVLLDPLINLVSLEYILRQRAKSDAKGTQGVAGEFLIALQNSCAPLRC